MPYTNESLKHHVRQPVDHAPVSSSPAITVKPVQAPLVFEYHSLHCSSTTLHTQLSHKSTRYCTPPLPTHMYAPMSTTPDHRHHNQPSVVVVVVVVVVVGIHFYLLLIHKSIQYMGQTQRERKKPIY